MLRPRPTRHAAGSSLVEVLVALVLLSLGLLAMASLQARTLVVAASARQASIAIQLASEWGERVRSRSDGVDAAAYETAWRSSTVGACGVPCEAGGVVERELHGWLSQAAVLLPEPALRVARAADDASSLDIRIAWRAGGSLAEAAPSSDCEPAGHVQATFACVTLRVTP